MSGPTTTVEVRELTDLHSRLGRLEGAARMAALSLDATPSSDEIRQIAAVLAELSIGQEQDPGESVECPYCFGVGRRNGNPEAAVCRSCDGLGRRRADGAWLPGSGASQDTGGR